MRTNEVCNAVFVRIHVSLSHHANDETPIPHQTFTPESVGCSQTTALSLARVITRDVLMWSA
jgi:hypothetical protein